MKLFTILSACLMLAACHTTSTSAPKQCSEKASCSSCHSHAEKSCGCCNKG